MNATTCTRAPSTRAPSTRTAVVRGERRSAADLPAAGLPPYHDWRPPAYPSALPHAARLPSCITNKPDPPHRGKMKLIRVVVSDLHLGTGMQSGRLNPHEDFFEDDRFAELLAYYEAQAGQDGEIELI